MPITYKCPSCSVIDSRPDYMAGQKTVCELCQKPGVVPMPKTAKPSLPEPLPPVDLPPEKPKVAVDPTRLKEPWYWGFPRSCAMIALVLASIAFSFCIVMAGIGAIIGLLSKDSVVMATAFSAAIYSSLTCLPVIFGCTLVLQATDACRDLRKIRLALQQFVEKRNS